MRHAVIECEEGIDWEHSGPIVMEKGWKQRRVKESLETVKAELSGKRVLNQCDQIEQGWRNLLMMER